MNRSPSGSRRIRPVALAALALVGLSGAASLRADAWIRVNQAGYLPDDPKIAILSSDQPLAGRFRVGEFEADVGPDQGAWGPFAHNYRLDFSPLDKPGRYRIRAAGAESPEFAVGPPSADNLLAMLSFMQLQRCGDNPVSGKKCHQQDAIDTETGRRVDLTGGWHDAGDRLKHMITTTYCVAALFLAADAARDKFPPDVREALLAEARHGAELVRKLHPDPETIYIQIGDDRDHAPPHTLWHDDQTDYGWGKGGPRSAWPALGRPQGPKYQNKSTGLSSIAGRTAAARALAGDLAQARSLYALARAKPGPAMSIPVRAPYYYMESDYYDDLEWAATELYVATREQSCLDDAVGYARLAGRSPWLGKPETPPATAASAPAALRPARHGHYEWFPYVNLAHWRLYPHADHAVQADLASYYRSALEGAQRIAEENPYRLGTPLVWCSTNDVIAVATQAVLYERMTGDRRFRPLAAECRDWLFGRNPWGVSFVIGVPKGADASSKPHHLFWLLEKHVPVGGLVDGPVYVDINESLKFAPWKSDRVARFQSAIGVFHDEFEDFSTNEPIIDGTVSLLLLLTLW